MSSKKWIFPECDKEAARSLAEECGIEPLCALLMLSRGIDDPVEIDEFFSCEELQIEDPYLLTDMEKAVGRINKAIENGERIAVFGDYDADGVTSTVLLHKYLKRCGADVIHYIPDRLSEGYGMNNGAVDKLAEKGVKLIITVDNGISCTDEIKYAFELGIDTVVTDHHLPGDTLPEAVAVVDPHRKDNFPEAFRYYAGVGVALKLICALEGDISYGFVKEYCELVAIGTVADIVPLTGENRALVKAGLKVIAENPSAGVVALIDVAGMTGRPVNSTALSFAVAPRINAAGRMGNCESVFELLGCDDEERAAALAAKVDDYNTARKNTEAEIYDKAVKMIDGGAGLFDAPIIVVGGENWHEGVLGIVASRLVKRYLKPAVVFSYKGDLARGSARSIGDFSIYDAVSYARDTVLGFGGHKMALGVTVKCENIEDFRKRLNDYCFKVARPHMPELHIDCKLNPLGVTVETAELLEGFEPFGQENSMPLFALCGMKIEAVYPLSGGKHISLNLSRSGYAVRTVFFGMDIKDFAYRVGDMVDVAVNLECGEFRGEKNLSVLIRDIRPALLDYESFYYDSRLCDDYFSGVRMPDAALKRLAPSRVQVGVLYKFMSVNKEFSGEADVLLLRTGMDSIGKLEISAAILSELGILKVKMLKTGFYLKACRIEGKRPIEGSKIYRDLHGLNREQNSKNGEGESFDR